MCKQPHFYWVEKEEKERKKRKERGLAKLHDTSRPCISCNTYSTELPNYFKAQGIPFLHFRQYILTKKCGSHKKILQQKRASRLRLQSV